MKMKALKSVYFIGIGGIGMSALARYFNDRGAAVSGYDKTETDLTKTLQQEGITIHFKEDVSNIPNDVQLIIYTPAIPSSHAELSWANAQTEIPVLKRAEVLGKIVNEGDCFAVAGSHGKSTTSAMLAHVFQTAGKHCTAFLGAIASNYQSNYIKGGTNCFVVEADEYDRSFHQIQPLSTIITSVDSDHLDIYGSLDGVEQGFQTYVEGVRENGTVFIEYSQSFQSKIKGNYYTYSIEYEQADYVASAIQLENGAYVFDVITPNSVIENVTLTMGGRYNIENALSVIAMASYYGIKAEAIREAFNTFTGLVRRFDVRFKTDDFVYIDDYAHHPNEIRAFIEGIRELYQSKKIAAIFQPHLYSRTKDYATHFAESLDLVDEAVLMDIYPAREEPIAGVSSQLIQQAMKKSSFIIQKEQIADFVEQLDADVLVTIGAGDIAHSIPKILEVLENQLKTTKPTHQ